MANWMSAQDVFKQLNKNEMSVLTGKAIVDYVDNIYKTDAKEVQQAAHRMAEAMAKQGHAAQASIMEIEREAAKAGFVPEFSYDATTHQITMRLSRQKGIPGDKGKVSIKPITVKLDVGSPKAGLNKGVPATQSLSAQAEEAGAYFATQLENQLEAIKNTLKSRNKSGGSKGISTAAFKHQINEAIKKGVQSLISHTTHVAVDSDIFADEMYEGDSRARQLFLQSNLRMAGAINSAIAKVRSKFGNIKRKTKSGNELELDDNYIARAIQTYIMVAQSKLGESAARQTLRKRGIEDGIIDVIKTHLGDILNLSNTANFGSDRSLQTMTVSSRGGRENLLGNYGEKSRHAQQGQNYLKKVSKGNRGFEKVFREINLDAEGFYDDAAQLMYTTAQFDPKSVKAAYEAAKKVIHKEVEQEVRKKSKNKTEDQIQETIEKRMRSMFGDFDPSVYDDMSIIRKSTLGDLTSVRTRTGSINEKRYKILETEAAEIFDKKIAGLKNGKSEFRYNGTTFNKADKGGFIEKYIASKVISGLKPGDIQFLTTEATKNENGDIIGYNIIAEQLVGAMAQQVKTVTDQGERNYAKGLSDRVFTEMLIQLGINPKEAEKIDFIKNKESLKSNNLAHRAIGRLSYLFNKTQDKSGFTKFLKNSPIGALLTNVGSESIQFAETPEALEAFVKAGGLTALYKWMEENEWGGEKIFDSSAPLIYSHTANLADVFDWTKRVQTGAKERAAQLRTAGASGSSQAYREAIERRYNKTSGRGAEVVKKAQHDIAQIESALYEKTAQTTAMSKKEVADYIKNQSFKSGAGDFSKRAITMGAGDSYSINTNLFKDIIAEYENGHISEAEFAKTWEGEVERIRNEMIAGGVNPDDIDVVFDPGQIFGFSDKYGDQYSGRLLHLGSIGANKHIDSLTGETVYDRVDYSSDVNALMKAIAGRGKNKQTRVSEAVHDVIMGMFKTAESNSGSLNERATKRRLGHSHSFHTSGISPEQIGDNADENRLIDSGFVSATAMKKLLMDTYDYEDGSGNINEQEYLQTLLTQLNAARNSSEEYKDYFDGLDTFEEKQKKIVDALMAVAKDTGLSGMFNRFPSIDSEAVKNSRLFISESIKDDDIMAVGAGLAKAINADFDGDTINVILKMIDTLDGFFGDNTEKFDQAVIKDVYQMYMASEKSDGKATDLSKELEKADDVFFNQLSGIAAKVNNINIGTFSNMSTRIRKSLSGTSFDESALIKTEDGVDYSSARNVAKGLLIKAVGQTLEQDAISSKKVEARISQKFLKLKETKGGELTQEEKDQIVAETLNEYEELINRIIAGDFTDDSDFLKALEEMGIAKNGKIESLGMRTAISQIKNLGLEKAQTVALFKDILGVDEATAKQIMITGEVDTTSLGGVMKSVSRERFGSEHGFFWGDQYHRPVASSREFGKGTKSDEYELMRLMKYEGYGQNVEAVTEGNKAFGERGEILKEVIDAYKDEIALEEKKIGVAGKEANAIKKLGTTWADYAKYINDTYDVAKEAATLQDKNSNFYVESKENLSKLGLERISPSTIRNILDPRSNMTTGVDESFLKGVRPLIKAYTKGATEQQRTEARNKLLNREELAAAYGIESGAVLDKTLSGAIATTGGSYAGAVAQGDKGTAKEAKKKLELLLYALGKTVNEVSETIEVFKTAGKNMGSVANRFGKTVGNEIPIAGISENGQYLIGGRMDTVRRSGGEDNSAYTVLDYKTHMGGNASAEDIAQVLIYQEALKAVQKQLQNADASTSNKDLLDLFRTEIAKALSVFGLSEGREGLINSFTEEDIGRLRKKTTQIKSGLVVADSRTGATSAYELASYLPANVRDIILGGDWHNKTDAEKASILAQAKKVTRSGYYKPGMETETSKEEERNKAQKEYVDLLEKEYDLRLKLAKWEKEYEAQKDTAGYNLLLTQKNKEIEDAEKASKEMAKKAGLDPNKNDLSSRYKAQFNLDLQKLLGGGSPKQSVWDKLGYNSKGLGDMIARSFSLWRVIGKIRQDLTKMVKIVQQLDKASTNIRIVTGMNQQQVHSLINTYSDLAAELGTTTQAIAESANTWLRQGYDVAAANKLIASTTKLSKLGMLDMNAATKVMTSTLKGFKMEAADSEKVVDKLTKLDSKFAASAGEIGEAISRTAALAQNANVSLDETAAMVTVIMDVTQQSAEMAGTALRTMLTRYGNVKAGSFLNMDEDDAENINDIEKVLGKLNIRIRNSSGSMRSFADVLGDLNKRWISLTDVEKNAIATAIAGARSRNQFLTIMSNYDRYLEAVEASETSEGTAAIKYAAQMESIEASLNKVQVAWEKTSRAMIDNNFMKLVLTGVEYLVKWLPYVINYATKLLLLLRTFGKINGVGSVLKTAGSKVGLLPAAAGGAAAGGAKKLNKIAGGLLIAGTNAVAGAVEGNNSAFSYIFGGELTKIKANETDTAISAGIRGGLGAIGSIWGPVGAMIGDIVGDAASTGIKLLIHHDEIEMKKRVEWNQKILEGITAIKSTVSSIDTLAQNRSDWTSEDKAQMYDYIDKMMADLREKDKAFTKEQSDAGETLEGTLDKYIAKLTNTELYSTIEELTKHLTDLDAAVAKTAASVLQQAELYAQAEIYWGSQEEEIDRLRKIILNPKSTIAQTSAAQAQLAQIVKTTNAYVLEGSFYGADSVDTWTSAQIEMSSVEEIKRRVAENAARRGLLKDESGNSLTSIYDAAGNLSPQIDQQITRLIYNDSRYTNLIKNNVLTLEELKKTQKKQSEIAKDTGKEWGELVKAAKTKGGLEKLLYGKTPDELSESEKEEVENISSLVLHYDAASSQLKNFAKELHISAKELANTSDDYWAQHLTLGDIQLSLEELTDKFQKLGSILGEITSTGYISAATLNELQKNYAFLLKDAEGNPTTSRKDIIRNIYDFILGTQGSVTSVSQFNDYMADSTVMEEFFDNLKLNDQQKAEKRLFGKNLQELLNSQILTENEKESLVTFMKAKLPEDYISEQFLNSVKIAQEYANREIDQSIKNLQEQKDALSKVNDEYKKQIDLIKKRQALENAQNEKKRVYRAGVGWTYEADAEAISKAREDLEEAEKKRAEENLQYQIDLLEKTKQILADIPEEMQLEAQKEAYEVLIETLTGEKGVNKSIESFAGILQTAYEKVNKIATGEEGSGTLINSVIKESETKLSEGMTGYKDITSNYSNTAEQYLYNAANPTEYNERLEEVKSIKEKIGASLRTQKEYNEDHPNSTEGEYAKHISAISGRTFSSDTDADEWVTNVGKDLKDASEMSEMANPTDWGYLEAEGLYIGESPAQKNILGKVTKPKEYVKFGPNMQSDPVDSKNQRFLEYVATNIKSNSDKIFRIGDDIFVLGPGGSYYPARLKTTSDKNGSDLVDTSWDPLSYYKVYANNKPIKTGKVNFYQSGGEKQSYASGTLNAPGGTSLVNELGLEGIVTPGGTLTALPAHSGVVPADLTRNLYELGEVAPNLIKQFSNGQTLNSKSVNNTEDNSMNVQNFYANFETKDGFDFNQLLVQARQYVATTRNSHR